MAIRPLFDRIIVRRIEEQKTTESGLIIPNSAAEKPAQGEIIAIGNGKKADDGSVITPEVAVGDSILFDQYAGNSEIKMDGESLLVMRESDVIGVIE